MATHTCHRVHIQRISSHVPPHGTRNGTRVIRLGSKPLYLLSHPLATHTFLKPGIETAFPASCPVTFLSCLCPSSPKTSEEEILNASSQTVPSAPHPLLCIRLSLPFVAGRAIQRERLPCKQALGWLSGHS